MHAPPSGGKGVTLGRGRASVALRTAVAVGPALSVLVRATTVGVLVAGRARVAVAKGVRLGACVAACDATPLPAGVAGTSGAQAAMVPKQATTAAMASREGGNGNTSRGRRKFLCVLVGKYRREAYETP